VNEELIKALQKDIERKTEEIAKLKEEMGEKDVRLAEAANDANAKIAAVENEARHKLEEAEAQARLATEEVHAKLAAVEAEMRSKAEAAEAQVRAAGAMSETARRQLEEARRFAEEAEVAHQVQPFGDDDAPMQDGRVEPQSSSRMDVDGLGDQNGAEETPHSQEQASSEGVGDVEDTDDQMSVEGPLGGDANAQAALPSPPRTPHGPPPQVPLNRRMHHNVPLPARYQHSAAQGYRLPSSTPATLPASPPTTACTHEHCVPVSAIASIVDQMKASPYPSPSPRQRQRTPALYFQKEIERKQDPDRTKFLGDIRPHMNLLLKIAHDIDILVSSARMEDIGAVNRFEAGETDEGPT
jgi:cell division septum initiation protein DivIVA